MLFHCSSLGLLMTEARSIDENLLTDDLRKIKAKKTKTQEEQTILDRLKRQTLSETAKSHIKSCVIREKYGFRSFDGSKHTEKGHYCEDDGINLVGLLHAKKYTKNTVRLENEWLTGECDILLDEIHDLKCPWSLGSFPFFDGEALKMVEEAGYDWQGRGYMMLYDKPKFHVHYLMLPTPEHLLSKFDNHEMYIDVVNQIPIHERIRTVTIRRDLAIEELIKQKVILAQEYAKTLVKQLESS
jgi:hypothetical protein